MLKLVIIVNLLNISLDIFIDTTGYAFTLPLFKYIGGCKTACYVHYPTITIEMLKRVSARRETYNNRGIIARSPFLTGAKLTYYRIFAWVRFFNNVFRQFFQFFPTFRSIHYADNVPTSP